ncbi:hypothetical protein HPB49_023563 [Dermacentor silvarum]|uniref:Uncharacterized protein n=1 Tax=Dermacentor silvarum TaxID=543639 RepID=A0ACB8CTN8_DERSI|nr:hypothetical protein HPB49_023563 [Dermacentor silvarum]
MAKIAMSRLPGHGRAKTVSGTKLFYSPLHRERARDGGGSVFLLACALLVFLLLVALILIAQQASSRDSDTEDDDGGDRTDGNQAYGKFGGSGGPIKGGATKSSPLQPGAASFTDDPLYVADNTCAARNTKCAPVANSIYVESHSSAATATTHRAEEYRNATVTAEGPQNSAIYTTYDAERTNAATCYHVETSHVYIEQVRVPLCAALVERPPTIASMICTVDSEGAMKVPPDGLCDFIFYDPLRDPFEKLGRPSQGTFKTFQSLAAKGNQTQFGVSIFALDIEQFLTHLKKQTAIAWATEKLWNHNIYHWGVMNMHKTILSAAGFFENALLSLKDDAARMVTCISQKGIKPVPVFAVSVTLKGRWYMPKVDDVDEPTIGAYGVFEECESFFQYAIPQLVSTIMRD